MSAEARVFAAVAALSLTTALAPPASAYCRSNSCDPRSGTCERDEDDCIVSGKPLSWQTKCVSFAVQEDGSPRHGISAERFEQEVYDAFERWLTVDCGDGTPSLEVQNIGPVSCDKVEYNQRDGNANLFVFRDVEWPYQGGEDALGLSTIRFDPSSGQVFDVDVEINGTDTPVTVGEVAPGSADLASILTHEVGHFLGLSHSSSPRATMRPGYSTGTDSLRTLDVDDVAGICEALSPSRTTRFNSCEPRHGFSSQCGGSEDSGCATRGPRNGESKSGFTLVALAALLGLSRARRLRRLR